MRETSGHMLLGPGDRSTPLLHTRGTLKSGHPEAKVIAVL